jgi:hypothetical protein
LPPRDKKKGKAGKWIVELILALFRKAASRTNSQINHIPTTNILHLEFLLIRQDLPPNLSLHLNRVLNNHHGVPRNVHPNLKGSEATTI